MKGLTKTRWVPVILLLLIALPLQQMSSHHQKGFSAHRRCAVSDLAGDNPGVEKRLRSSIHTQQPAEVSEQTIILVDPSPMGLMKANEIVLSRQASTLFSLHLLVSQTASSAS